MLLILEIQEDENAEVWDVAWICDFMVSAWKNYIDLSCSSGSRQLLLLAYKKFFMFSFRDPLLPTFLLFSIYFILSNCSEQASNEDVT